MKTGWYVCCSECKAEVFWTTRKWEAKIMLFLYKLSCWGKIKCSKNSCYLKYKEYK